MYTPRHFKETRNQVLRDLLHSYPFATLVTTHPVSGLAINHLPFELVGDALLHGHVARGNELADMDGAEVRVIFQGPDGYISPNWYPSKHETGREVPTWNYAVAHVYGRLRVVKDKDWLRRLLQTLTDRHELGQPAPWRVSDAPADHVDQMLGAIVGLEIAIERIEGKFKLSQNHPASNRAGVIQGLHQRADHRDAELAQMMTTMEKLQT
ncbi:FMN-binding negative transcriptional regulator [Dyella silvatica]|uniref:FMN-binding negative transcriptional regulator n=1 Tax=Dyella silvatica TaxID=2992128 RepID=UPI002250AEE8|nr:FMN-binding negative transcriptional regulator [Dyella silvatica]